MSKTSGERRSETQVVRCTSAVCPAPSTSNNASTLPRDAPSLPSRPRIGPRLRFWFFWLAVVLSHVLSAAYLLVFAAVHVVLNTQTFFKRQLSVQTNLTCVVLLYIILSTVHARRVYTILRASVRRRRLCFESVRTKQQQLLHGTTAHKIKTAASAIPLPRSSSLRAWTRSGAQLWHKYLARSGLFGIFGKHGDVRIWSVEYLNLGAHVFQATRWSRLWRPSTNLVVTILLCCECFVPAFYHKANRTMSDVLRARLLLLDIIIDTVICAVIPTWLIAPFALQYLDEPHVVNSNFAETWYAEGVLTFKQSLATTLPDLATKVSPFCLNYLSLVEITSGQHLPEQDEAAQAAKEATVDSRFSSVVVSNSHLGATSVSSSRKRTEIWRRRSKTLAFCVLRLGFAGWGGLFLLMTLKTLGWHGDDATPCPQGCLFETDPWFRRDCNCIAQEMNCAKLNISGTHELAAELEVYAGGEDIVVLVLHHCRELVVPPAIRRFPNLLGIYVYSSELVRWDEDAALSSDTFGSITYVMFVNSSVAAIPRGLLSNLAPTVQDIEIIASPTPVTIPDDLHERWRGVGTLYIERCNLTAFPAPLLQMTTLTQLSLAGNAITELPEELFTSPLLQTLGYLILSANPALARLPPRLDATPSLLELYIDATNISILDLANVSNSSGLTISAAQTPVCADDGATLSNASRSRVSCAGLYSGMYTLGVYPFLPEQRARRPARILPSEALLTLSGDDT